MSKYQYSKISIRTVNAFLRRKGIDPSELKASADVVKLTRKDKAKIEELCAGGRKALVHVKGRKYVIMDSERKFQFEKVEVREKANRVSTPLPQE